MNSAKKPHPTILLVNFHSACNAGDAALLASSIRQLRSCFGEPRIVVSSNYPDESYVHLLNVQVIPSFGALIGAKERPTWQQVPLSIIGILLGWIAATMPCFWNRLARMLPASWLKFIDAYGQADLVVNCPGNQFFTMGAFGWPLLISAASLIYAYLFKKPVYVLPQSIGPLKRRWERYLIKWLFTRARIVFVREPLSLRLARDLGLPIEKVKFSPDLAFDSPVVDQGQALVLLESLGYDHGKGAVGVTVINRMTGSLKKKWFGQYYSAMAAALERLVKKYEVKIYFFPQVTGPSLQEDDRIAAHKVAEMMKDVINEVVLVDESFSPEMLKCAYGLMDIFVATRMHSGIFASSMGTPTLFIGYLSKIQGLVESLDLQDWLIELNDIEEASLWEKLEELWLKRDTLRMRLSDKMPEVAKQTRQVGELIAEDYYGNA